MPKFQDYSTDLEAQSIATAIQEKFGEMFEGHDLSRVAFYRVRKDSKVPTKVVKTGFPFDAVGGTYVYYVLVFENMWERYSDEQRKMAILEALLHIPHDGFDEESNNYAKLRKRDVSEYSETLAAAGGVYNWKEEGVRVGDILEETPSTSIDADENGQ